MAMLGRSCCATMGFCATLAETRLSSTFNRRKVCATMAMLVRPCCATMGFCATLAETRLSSTFSRRKVCATMAKLVRSGCATMGCFTQRWWKPGFFQSSQSRESVCNDEWQRERFLKRRRRLRNSEVFAQHWRNSGFSSTFRPLNVCATMAKLIRPSCATLVSL